MPLLVFLASTSATYGASSEKAEEILKRAVKYSSSVNYRYENTSNGMTTTYYVKNNPDGTAYQRMETVFASGNRKLDIRNADGSFSIIDGNVIQEKIPPLPKQKKSGEAKPVENEYSLRSGSFDNIDCHIVKSIAASGYVTDIYIGKKNHFIYAMKYFSPDGKLLMPMEYHKVEFMPDMPDTLFAIPENAKIKIVRTGAEYDREAVKSFKSNRQPKSNAPSRWGRMFDAAVEFFFAHSRLLSVILFLIGCAVLGSGIVLRLINRKKR